MSATAPLRVLLTLGPAGPETQDSFRVSLRDLSLTGHAAGVTRLYPEIPIDDGGTTIADVLFLFTTRGGLRHAEALAFGRFLHGRLLGASEELSRLWAEIDADLVRTGRPLHFLLELPGRPRHPGAHEPAWSVADLPFEFLADKDGFLFQRFGNVLVRTFHGLKQRTPSIPHGGNATLVWANPQVLGADGTLAPLPDDLFTRHEALLAEAAPALGLTLVSPCDRATRRRLGAHLRDHAPVHVVSIVAHGADTGGAMLLHEEQNGQATDHQEPVQAQQLATMLRAGGVDVALLWMCYGARRDRHIGSLAETLLRPDGGDVPVVIASHAALGAAATLEMARALFDALAGNAGRDLERALSETWQRALGEDNQQWAAPVYYARPELAQSARIEDSMAAADQRASAIAAPGRAQPSATRATRVAALEHAPPLTEHFRGRDDDVARGQELLAEYRLVSIHGMPGIGKTALSLAIAGRTLTHANFDRAVWYPLDGARTADVLAARLAQDAQAQDMDAVAIARAMGRDASWLIVLDNAEDLIDADRAGLEQFVDTLLREHAGVRFLLTTRHRLGNLQTAREALLPVRQLEPPHDLDLFRATAGERLMPAARDNDEVRELVGLLDGHPQSIVLVASQVGELPLATIRRRIERDDVDAVIAAELIGEPDAGDRRAAQRAKRLLASLDLSYQPLAERHPAAAEMFTWLGALPAGLPAVLAPHVFGEDADEAIAVLLQYNLVEQRGPDRRLSMPAPLRWYAARHIATLTDSKQLALMASTTHALLAWMTAIDAQVGTPEARHAYDRILAEQPNLAALIERAAVASDHRIMTEWGLIMALWSQAMLLAGRSSAAIPVLQRAQVLQPRGNLGEANTLRALGDLHLHTTRLQEAEKAFAAALSIFQQLEDSHGEANTRRALGELYLRTYRFPEAEQSYKAVLPVFQQLKDLLGEANTRRALGDLYVRTNNFEEAEKNYRAALTLFQQAKDPLGEATARRALGDLYVRKDQLEEAKVSYETALQIFRQIDARLGEANTLRMLGDLYLRTGHLQEAEESYKEALPIFTSIEERVGEASTQKALGDLYLRTNRLQEAEGRYAAALPLFQEMQERLGEANTQKAWGDLYVRTNHWPEAERSYHEALTIYEEIEDRLGEANTRRALGDVHLQTNRLQPAEECYEAALLMYQGIHYYLGEAYARKALGDVYLRTNRLQEAENSYTTALTVFQDRQSRLGEANTRQAMGTLALRLGRVAQAFAHYRQALPLHEAVENAFGVAPAYAGLARAARLAGSLERAVVLGAQAQTNFRVIADRLGERRALDDMRAALAVLNSMEGAVAAAVLAWELAYALGEADASARGEFVARMSEGVDPTTGPPSELLEQVRPWLAEAIQACREALAARGEDPLGPLSDVDNAPVQ